MSKPFDSKRLSFNSFRIAVRECVNYCALRLNIHYLRTAILTYVYLHANHNLRYDEIRQTLTKDYNPKVACQGIRRNLLVICILLDFSHVLCCGYRVYTVIYHPIRFCATAVKNQLYIISCILYVCN